MSKPSRLPPYDVTMSDGCSLAPFLPLVIRPKVQDWMIRIIAGNLKRARRMRSACVIHDAAYYYGGTPAQRLATDKALRASWRVAGAPYWFRFIGYRAVRFWGRPHFRQSGVSWAYGKKRFKFDDPGV